MTSVFSICKGPLPLLFLPMLSFAVAQSLPACAQPAQAPALDAPDQASPRSENEPATAPASTGKPAFPQRPARILPTRSQAQRGALSSGEVSTLGLMTAGIDGTFLQIGNDISTVTSTPSMRVVPLIGKGSLQNIGDLLNLHGVDLALVDVDAARFAETKNLFPGLRSRMQYITKLYDEEVHILAGSDVHSLSDLAGKTVNVDVEASGTAVTAAVLFAATNVQVKMAHDPPDLGLLKLQRGEIAANVYGVGKPNRLFTQVPAGSGLHFIPVPVSKELVQTYVPSTFRHADYPNLVAENEVVATIAGPVLLMCYNWPAASPRYKNLVAFTDALFSHLPDLQRPPHHPKWREVNLAAKVPGWTRAPFVQQWLDRAAAKGASAFNTQASTPEEQEFTRWAKGIGLANLTADQRTQLFSLWQLRRNQPQH